MKKIDIFEIWENKVVLWETAWGKIISSVLVMLALVGVFSIHHYNNINAGGVLEAILALSAIIFFTIKGNNLLIFWCISLFYLVVTFTISMVLSHNNVLDYMQAYKAFFYILVISSL